MTRVLEQVLASFTQRRTEHSHIRCDVRLSVGQLDRRQSSTSAIPSVM